MTKRFSDRLTGGGAVSLTHDHIIDRLHIIQSEVDELIRDFGMNKAVFPISADEVAFTVVNDPERDINLTGILDACVDIIYATEVTAHLLGLGPVLETAFDRVHQANMEKDFSTIMNPTKPQGWEHPDLSDLVHKAFIDKAIDESLVPIGDGGYIDTRVLCHSCGAQLHGADVCPSCDEVQP